MWKRLLLLTALLIPSLACFEIQGEHTLYLAPDGTIVWIVLEDEIRFYATTRDARRQQHDEFLDRVTANEHPAALSLEALYPASIRARVLREDTPPAILTEAHFPGIDRLYQNLFGLYRVVSSVQLKVGERHAHLEILFWVDEEEEEEESDADEPDAAGEEGEGPRDEFLLAPLLECRIVLTEGRFVAAEGFEIVDLGQAAKPLPLETEEAQANNTPVRLSLTWTLGDDGQDEFGPNGL